MNLKNYVIKAAQQYVPSINLANSIYESLELYIIYKVDNKIKHVQKSKWDNLKSKFEFKNIEFQFLEETRSSSLKERKEHFHKLLIGTRVPAWNKQTTSKRVGRQNGIKGHIKPNVKGTTEGSVKGGHTQGLRNAENGHMKTIQKIAIEKRKTGELEWNSWGNDLEKDDQRSKLVSELMKFKFKENPGWNNYYEIGREELCICSCGKIVASKGSFFWHLYAKGNQSHRLLGSVKPGDNKYEIAKQKLLQQRKEKKKVQKKPITRNTPMTQCPHCDKKGKACGSFHSKHFQYCEQNPERMRSIYKIKDVYFDQLIKARKYIKEHGLMIKEIQKIDIPYYSLADYTNIKSFIGRRYIYQL
jgi:hypothetical protein